MSSKMNTHLDEFQLEVRAEVESNILTYWLGLMDVDNGGFYGEADFTGVINVDANKSVLLHSRILWTFSSAYRVFRKPEYLAAAKHCYQFMVKHALDEINGGVFWMLDKQGAVIDDQKHVYNQGFAIYALSEYYLASQDTQALDYAMNLFLLVEDNAVDTQFGGYFEAFDCYWMAINNDLVCHDEGRKAVKSMNTHLHLLEAYTVLYEASSNQDLNNKQVLKKIESLLVLMKNKIINSEYHFGLFFTENWHCLSKEVSYGHDIEGAWLMDKAISQLTDKALMQDLSTLTLQLATTTKQQGIGLDGSVFNELSSNDKIDKNKIWWVQSEAMVGFFNAYQKCGNSDFVEASLTCWNVIKTSFVDHVYGEWFGSVNDQGEVKRNESKTSTWKCPYHNSRACLEIYARIPMIKAASNN